MVVTHHQQHDEYYKSTLSPFSLCLCSCDKRVNGDNTSKRIATSNNLVQVIQIFFFLSSTWMLYQFDHAPSTIAWCSDVRGPFASLPLRWWSLYGTTALIGENWQWLWRHEHDFAQSISDGRGREAKVPRTTSDVWASGYIHTNPDILTPQILLHTFVWTEP